MAPSTARVENPVRIFDDFPDDPRMFRVEERTKNKGLGRDLTDEVSDLSDVRLFYLLALPRAHALSLPHGWGDPLLSLTGIIPIKCEEYTI
jgi:hypothetical protein